jgi:hypothetical protein
MIDQFKGIAQVVPGAGDMILFWKDLWNGSILQYSYPQLFSSAKDENISVLSVLQHGSLEELFHLPFSKEAFEQFCEFQILVQSLDLNNNHDTGHISGVWEFFIKEML